MFLQYPLTSSLSHLSTTVTLILEKSLTMSVGGIPQIHTHKSFPLGMGTLSHWDPVRQKEILATTTKMVKEFLNSHKNGQPYHIFTSL